MQAAALTRKVGASRFDSEARKARSKDWGGLKLQHSEKADRVATTTQYQGFVSLIEPLPETDTPTDRYQRAVVNILLKARLRDTEERALFGLPELTEEEQEAETAEIVRRFGLDIPLHRDS